MNKIKIIDANIGDILIHEVRQLNCVLLSKKYKYKKRLSGMLVKEHSLKMLMIVVYDFSRNKIFTIDILDFTNFMKVN